MSTNTDDSKLRNFNKTYKTSINSMEMRNDPAEL